MRRPVRILAALGALALAPFALVWSLNDHPQPEMVLEANCSATPRTLKKGDSVGFLSWNLQYAGSRKYHFFYDGGNVTRPEMPDVEATLAEIGRVLRDQGADILLLQEVDRDSARTGRVDQLPSLVQAANAPCAVSAQYHRSAFVPTPVPDFLGRVDMHLALLSRYAMQDALRTQLPLMKEAWIRREFNLKRALLTAEVPVEGMDQPLAIAVTHLSAFSYGDGSMEEQVRVLKSWMESRPANQPWVLSGDMNLLPPGDDPKRLGTDAAYYADASNPVEMLIPQFQEIFGDKQLDPASRTYITFGASEPDRKIDYVFYGGPVELLEARVVSAETGISDHLPIAFTLRVGEAPEQAAWVAPERKTSGALEENGVTSTTLVERRNRERPLRKEKDPNTDSRADTGSPGNPKD